jgi:hypothetical protein
VEGVADDGEAAACPVNGVPRPPTAQIEAWNRQVVRAKMFQNLIGDIDPNLGNWLVDPAWNLILIDHTRAVTPTKDLYHALTQADGELWERMKALDEAKLKATLGSWLDDQSIRGISGGTRCRLFDKLRK